MANNEAPAPEPLSVSLAEEGLSSPGSEWTKGRRLRTGRCNAGPANEDLETVLTGVDKAGSEAVIVFQNIGKNATRNPFFLNKLMQGDTALSFSLFVGLGNDLLPLRTNP